MLEGASYLFLEEVYWKKSSSAEAVDVSPYYWVERCLNPKNSNGKMMAGG